MTAMKIKTVAYTLLFLILSGVALAEEQPDFNKLVDAIYFAEGAERAKKPFGILSVSCDGYEDCRKICYNTVRNNWRRWQNKTHNADKYNTYLEFLASRYAPIGVSNDPTNLNKNWLKNVTYFYNKTKG